jgi:hypothetical protein
MAAAQSEHLCPVRDLDLSNILHLASVLGLVGDWINCVFYSAGMHQRGAWDVGNWDHSFNRQNEDSKGAGALF